MKGKLNYEEGKSVKDSLLLLLKNKRTINTFLLLSLFILSLINVSGSFVVQVTPAFYFSVGGCLLFGIFVLVAKYKNQTMYIYI